MPRVRRAIDRFDEWSVLTKWVATLSAAAGLITPAIAYFHAEAEKVEHFKTLDRTTTQTNASIENLKKAHAKDESHFHRLELQNASMMQALKDAGFNVRDVPMVDSVDAGG